MKQVLLIDDNPVQLSIREAVLRDAGLQVSAATTAESALATLRSLQDSIGVVVTDHVMPGTSGLDVVREIRGISRALPIIVLSGLVEAEPEYDDLDVIFRAKPFPPQELIALVRSSLQQGESGPSAA
ncbi:MAG TPA: response regulator [Candidatus Binatia bacterium]|nr:response regulator [Candidatus Binatia bacterium]